MADETKNVNAVSEGKDYILEVNGLKQYFPVSKTFTGKVTRYLRAVDGVSFKLERGKTLGIVGESGCGKTTLGRTVLRLYDVTEGSAIYRSEINGEMREVDLAKLSRKELGMLRTELQLIFQDPYSSLPPRMTVGAIIGEAVKIHGIVPADEVPNYVRSIMKRCGLQEHHYDRYPHEFSGGQRQRIGIARAVVMQPEMIIADEPISALDVSIQAQVINLLNDLRERLGLTILFIAHDLSVVKYFSDRIGVMYFGKMVELADSDELFKNPLHPYTKSLLSAIPLPDPVYEKQRVRVSYNPLAEHDYSVNQPTFREITPGHFVYCNDAEEEKYKAMVK